MLQRMRGQLIASRLRSEFIVVTCTLMMFLSVGFASAAQESINIKMMPNQQTIEAGQPIEFAIERSGFDKHQRRATESNSYILTIEKVSTASPYLHASYLPKDTVVETSFNVSDISSIIYAFEDVGTYKILLKERGEIAASSNTLIRVGERSDRTRYTIGALVLIFFVSALFGYSAYAIRAESTGGDHER